MNNGFKISRKGHEKQARELIIKEKLIRPEDLALMGDWEVEQAINENYMSFAIGENWMLVPNDKYEEFCKLITWICR